MEMEMLVLIWSDLALASQPMLMLVIVLESIKLEGSYLEMTGLYGNRTKSANAVSWNSAYAGIGAVTNRLAKRICKKALFP